MNISISIEVISKVIAFLVIIYEISKLFLHRNGTFIERTIAKELSDQNKLLHRVVDVISRR